MVTSQDSAGDRLKPIWLALCFVLGAGLAPWSLYLLGLIVLLAVSGALGSATVPRRRSRASLVALILGFESGLASLAILYFLAWGQRSVSWYLYLGGLAVVGLLIVVIMTWWRERHGPASANHS